MSETARLLGTPGEITWQGKTFKVSRITFEIEGFFEGWLENQLSAALERARAVNSSQVYRDRLREANAQLAAGDLAYDGEIARRAAITDRGFAEIAFYCLGEHQPNWTRAEHKALCADREKFQELYLLIQRLGAPVPNAASPASPAGLTSPAPSGSPSSQPTAA